MIWLSTHGQELGFFSNNSAASRYIIPCMLDMHFPCEAIAKDDTKEFCFWNYFDW